MPIPLVITFKEYLDMKRLGMDLEIDLTDDELEELIDYLLEYQSWEPIT